MKKKDVTSNQLLEAALELFAEHGLERTSLAMIAGKVGITKPSIYYHFSSKEELVQRVFDHMFKDHYFDRYFITEIDQLTKESFGERLYQGGIAMLPDDNKEHFTVMRVLNEFMLIAARDDGYRERLILLQQEFLNGFRDLLLKGAELGAVPDRNIDQKAHILALVIDNLSTCIMMKFKINEKDVWKEAVNSVLVGEAQLK